MAALKRFWEKATAEAADGGFAVRLDGRPIRTPGGRLLLLPSAAMAQALAGEWQAVAGEVRPDTMPLTGLANAAIDIVATDAAGFAGDLARYAATDMLCYRAEAPEPLVARQAEHWDPLLAWAERRYDVRFAVTAGLVPVDQPTATLARLAQAYAGYPPLALAALSPLTTLSGSAVLPLALADDALSVAAAWAAAILDEAWQAELWGEDSLAAANRADRQRQFMAAERFLRLAQAAPPLQQRG